MTSRASYVKVYNAALDDAPDSPARVVLRGALDIGTLKFLMVDDYQREAQPMTSQGRIIEALTVGDRLPDVDLGMRGEDFQERDGAFFCKDPTYIIDGVQRISTIIAYCEQNPTAKVSIGAVIHLNTTREWERNRFHKLNNFRSKLSPSVLLRNMKDENSGVRLCYTLSTGDKALPIHGRVAWHQRMRRGDLITALTLCRTIAILHRHKVFSSGTDVDSVGRYMECLVTEIGPQAVRENIRAFFNVIDSCWGIKSVQYKEGAIYMRGAFLSVLAGVLSDHHDFWRGDDEKHLFVNADMQRKIAQFPIHDPEIARLSGSSGAAKQILYILLRDHINKGKKVKRLSSRTAANVADQLDDAD